MPLHGKAFVAIWHGIQAGAESEYLAWHTEEHMPERLGIPGFLEGRRYIDWSRPPHQSFTLYQGAHIETFRSPGYLARLNEPTAWSKAVQPSMTDFLRGGCETLLSVGDGIGGSIAVYRFGLRTAKSPDKEADLLNLALALWRSRGVTSVHLGRHAQAVTGGATAETALRPSSSSASFDYVLMLEGLAPSTLTEAAGRAEAQLAKLGAADVAGNVYPLDFVINAPS
jgi:hypothetical protein